MNKVVDYIKTHKVELIGFLVIMIIILLVTYLKNFNRQFECVKENKFDGSVIKEKYLIKQRNNNVLSISYELVSINSSKETISSLSELYREIIKKQNEISLDNNVHLDINKKIVSLSYDVSKQEINNNDNYKKASKLIKRLENNKFVCK